MTATHLLVRQYSINIAEFWNREDQPSIKPHFWSRNPGKMIDAFTGKEATSNSKFLTLFETIKAAATGIHRVTLRSAADFVVVNESLAPLFENLTVFRPDKASNPSENLEAFDDRTKRLGVLGYRYEVFINNDMPRDKILVGLLGNGLEYKIKNSFVPEVEVKATINPRTAKNELSYWTYVNVLDME